MIEIRIPFDPNRTNPNRKEGRHPAVRAANRKKHERALEDLTRWQWAQKGSPRATGRVVVETVVRRGARLDDDNLIAALKMARDALFAGRKFVNDGGAVTPDDGERWCRFLPPVQETGKEHRFREEIIYRVYEESEYERETGADGERGRQAGR